MGQEPDLSVLEDVFELSSLLEKRWPKRLAALRASGVPLMEGGDDPDDPDPDTPPADENDPPDDSQTFSAEYVRKLREEAARHRREAREAQARAAEYENQNKTEAQRLEDRATGAESRAVAAERELARTKVALRKGLTEAQAKRLIGDTEEELEADADELLATFQTDDDGQDPLRRTPRERLRPGATPPAEPEETDPAKLAALVPRRF